MQYKDISEIAFSEIRTKLDISGFVIVLLNLYVCITYVKLLHSGYIVSSNFFETGTCFIKEKKENTFILQALLWILGLFIFTLISTATQLLHYHQWEITKKKEEPCNILQYNVISNFYEKELILFIYRILKTLNVLLLLLLLLFSFSF